MIEYFCVGSTLCLRKPRWMCEICFRMVCDKHIHHIMPGDFKICSKCKKTRESHPFHYNTDNQSF